MKRILWLIVILTLLISSQSFAVPPMYCSDPNAPPAGDFTIDGDLIMTGSTGNQVILPQSNDPTDPAICFNGGGTCSGVWEVSDGVLGFGTNGSKYFELAVNQFRAANASGGAILNEAATSTNPTLPPNRGDLDSGMGSAAADQPNIVCGGKECLRLTEIDETGTRNTTFYAMPKIDMRALGTMTNGSTETTLYIDTDPAGEWAEIDSGSIVTITEDATYYRDSTNSVKVAFTSGASENVDGVDGTIVQDDLSGNESIGFWIYSDTALTSGDLDVTLDDTDGTDQAYTIGTVVVDTWTWIELDISGCDANCDTTDGIKILLTAQGETNLSGSAFNIYIDAMYKWDSADEETLGRDVVTDGVMAVNTLIDADNNVHRMVRLTEWTDYFIHYQSTDAIVIISDQSTKSGIALIAYE